MNEWVKHTNYIKYLTKSYQFYTFKAYIDALLLE